jgi:hypothetical protein
MKQLVETRSYTTYWDTTDRGVHAMRRFWSWRVATSPTNSWQTNLGAKPHYGRVGKKRDNERANHRKKGIWQGADRDGRTGSAETARC